MSATVTCPSWCNANGNQPCVGDHFRDIGSVKASGGDIMQRIEGGSRKTGGKRHIHRPLGVSPGAQQAGACHADTEQGN